MDYEYEFCKEFSDYGEPNGCNRVSGECGAYVLFTSIAAERDKLHDEKRMLKRNLAAYRQAEQDGTLVKCVDKRVYAEAGNNLWIIYDGEVLQVMHCGADVDSDGKVYATLAAEDKIFPYREPDAEHDTDPTDWCRNTIYLTPEDFKVMVYDTEESANAALERLK